MLLQANSEQRMRLITASQQDREPLLSKHDLPPDFSPIAETWTESSAWPALASGIQPCIYL